MAKRGRPSKHGGTVYKRNDSDIWQVRYKDQKGEMIRESAAMLQRIASRRNDSCGIASMHATRDACRFCLAASDSHSTSGPTGFWRNDRSLRFGARAIIR